MSGLLFPYNLIVRPLLTNFQLKFRCMKRLVISLLTKPLLLLWKMFFHYHPEVLMGTKDHITHHGYPVETYHATTEDGYILNVYRIPHGKDEKISSLNNTGTKIPVLLQHGLLGSSAHWVFNLPQNSLAFLLADAGFDVFLGNFRGASRKHQSLNPNKAQFWKFSWDEMIRYDMPAIIDSVLQVSGHQQLYCIGHSMGASVIFCMLDIKPEYNDKIKAMFALAAVGNLEKLSRPLRNLAKYLTPLIDKILVKTLGIHEFYFLRLIPKIVLGQITNYYRKSIVYILFISIGSDWVRWNPSTPPRYNLSNVKVPVHLFYGANDKGTSKENVEFLKRKLSNVMGMHQAGDSHWNHISYLTAVDAGEVFYQKLINMVIDEEKNYRKSSNLPQPVIQTDY